MEKSPKRIGEILIARGCVTEAQVMDALRDQKLSGNFLGSILLDKGLITETELMQALGEQFNLPFVEIKNQNIQMELSRKFSAALIIDHKCFPLSEDESSVTVAIVNPLNAVALAKLEEEASPKTLKLVLACEDELTKLIIEYRQYVSQNIARLLKKKPAEGST